MDNIFIVKLITSFFVGGLVIASLGWFAERANKKVAGIILSLPSTVVISYIFIGWTLSAQDVSNIVPSTIISAGAVQIFTIAYLYLSKLNKNKVRSLVLSMTGSIFVWLILSIPAAVFKISNIYLAMLEYLVMVFIGYYFLTIKNKATKPQTLLKYTNLQKIGRAIFAGSIIALAVLLANILNPFWGGIFGSFPAVFTSTFVILHWYYGNSMIEKVVKAIPIGSIIYVVFILAVKYTYPAFGIIFGTIVAYLISLVSFVVLFRKQNEKIRSSLKH